MIDHISLKVNNLKTSTQFFRNALLPLGYTEVYEGSETVGFGTTPEKYDLWLFEDTSITDLHSFSCLAFRASSKEMVDSFFEGALSAGGVSNGEPGYRTQYAPGHYAAYVHDPNGYNIEVVYTDRDVT